MRGCNEPAKLEYVGRMCEERGLDVLVVTETMLKGESKLGIGSEWISGIATGSPREGVGILIR